LSVEAAVVGTGSFGVVGMVEMVVDVGVVVECNLEESVVVVFEGTAGKYSVDIATVGLLKE
jgi:hypothetical protein